MTVDIRDFDLYQRITYIQYTDGGGGDLKVGRIYKKKNQHVTRTATPLDHRNVDPCGGGKLLALSRTPLTLLMLCLTALTWSSGSAKAR